MNKRETFETLLQECRGAVERTVFFRISRRADAEDVLQEVYMTAYRRFDTLMDLLAFKAWIISIARNKCVDYYRKRAAREELPMEMLSERVMAYGRCGLHLQTVVRETLEQLTKKDREILKLHYFQELPQAEIAKKLQVPLGTVKSRLHTARENFRDLYPGQADRGLQGSERNSGDESAKRIPPEVFCRSLQGNQSNSEDESAKKIPLEASCKNLQGGESNSGDESAKKIPLEVSCKNLQGSERSSGDESAKRIPTEASCKNLQGTEQNLGNGSLRGNCPEPTKEINEEIDQSFPKNVNEQGTFCFSEMMESQKSVDAQKIGAEKEKFMNADIESRLEGSGSVRSEAAGNEAGRSKVAGNKIGRSEAAGSEIGRSEAAGNEVAGNKVAGNKTAENKATGAAILPDFLPDYTITASQEAPFETVWEELQGWMIVPRQGERLTWGLYEMPSRRRTEYTELEVTGRAEVHGIEGVEIAAVQYNAENYYRTGSVDEMERRFVAQLTDTHSRYLAESHTENGVRKLYTFLDGDCFMENWGFGEDNCGNETHIVAKGILQRMGNQVVTAGSNGAGKANAVNDGVKSADTLKAEARNDNAAKAAGAGISGSQGSTQGRAAGVSGSPDTAAASGAVESRQHMDVVGRYTVTIAGKSYDTICMMDVETFEDAIATESYIDKNGRTVLWRRFNRDDWAVEHFGGKCWSEALPDNERLLIDGRIYVHWYDCISDYIL